MQAGRALAGVNKRGISRLPSKIMKKGNRLDYFVAAFVAAATILVLLYMWHQVWRMIRIGPPG